MLDRIASSSAMYFSVSFGGYSVTIVGKSTLSRLDVLPHYDLSTHTDTEEGLQRPKRLDGGACQRYIVTIDPPKDTERFVITDDEALRSNIKLLTDSPRGKMNETARGRRFAVRIPPQKYNYHKR